MGWVSFGWKLPPEVGQFWADINIVEFPQETSLQLGWRMRDWSPYVYGDMPSTDLTVKATDCEGLSSISSHTLYEDYTKFGSFDLFSNFPEL